MNNDKNNNKSRRDFVKTSAAVGTGLMIVSPSTAFSYAANSSLGLGVIGCGGRGHSDAGDFVENADVRVTALMDAFEDRVEAMRNRFDKIAADKGQTKISDSNLFKGWRSYEKLVQSKDVDIVLITSPPYFHPTHLEAAVDAGKHVYCEKPVATDVTGALKVMNIGKKAEGKVSLHVGFQKRYDVGYKSVVDKIHAGEIGDIVLGNGFYFTNDLGRQNKPGMSSLEARLRNWVFDQMLSGDIIVEQNIHIIDIINWAMKATPIKVSGTAGRAMRKEVEGIPANMLTNDHYILTYTYPGDIHVNFASNQFKNKAYRQQGEKFFGTKGIAETLQGGEKAAKITDNVDRGNLTYEGKVDLGDAIGRKIKALVASIQSGKFENQAQQGAETTLTTIMARMAVQTRKEISWDKMLKSGDQWKEKLNLDSLTTSV